MVKPNVNWHSALVSGMKIELSAYSDILTFIPEYTLNTGSRRIDCLIEKKRGSPPIDSPIASRFRQYNLMDYKSPYESMTIDNFYKVLSYAFSLPEFLQDASVIDHLSVMLITHKHPRKLLQYLKRKLGKSPEKPFPGIYDISAEIFPIRIVVMRELPKEEYLWLHCLTNKLNQELPLQNLAQAYLPHKEEKEYQNYMNQFIRANYVNEEEGKIMCEALYELFADELIRREQLGEKRGEKRGERRGEKRGEQRVAALIHHLITDHRGDEIERVVSDAKYRKILLGQYQL